MPHPERHCEVALSDEEVFPVVVAGVAGDWVDVVVVLVYLVPFGFVAEYPLDVFGSPSLCVPFCVVQLVEQFPFPFEVLLRYRDWFC